MIGLVSITLGPPGRKVEVGTVENDTGEAALSPLIHEQSTLTTLHQEEVVCREEGISTEPPMATENESGERCERANELDATADLQSLQIRDQTHVKKDIASMEISSTGTQTVTSSGQSVSDKQGPWTSSVLIDCDVQKMSPEDENVSSEVKEVVSVYEVYNNDGHSNHEEGARAVCSEERGSSAKERPADETLKENEQQSRKMTSSRKISKPKGRNTKQRKASKGASKTRTASKAEDNESPQNTDENTCFEVETSRRQPETAADDDISARAPPGIHEHYVSRNINCVNVVTTGAKVASEKEIEDWLGGSVEEEPKTKPDQETIFPVKNERALVKEEKTATRREVTGATNLAKGSTKVNICTPRPHGVAGRDIMYEEGSVLDAEENRELEFKSFVRAQRCSLRWKIMEKAKKFICGCLNADRKGIIYFGVGDNQEQDSKYKHGEILGLEVEDIKDEVNKALQVVLDDHIKSDAGALQKGGEQNCVTLHFIPVMRQSNRTNLYVIEIEVSRDWRFCKDNVYYSKTWSAKRGVQDCDGKNALSDFFKVKDEYDDVAVRTNGASSCVKQRKVDRQVKKPLEARYKEWRRQVTKHGAKDPSEEISLDDADVKKFSVVLRERLRELNHKEYGYILVANKLPAKYRGTAHLSFLQNIPWRAVFDLFDAGSKEDGLHYACNETTDAPRAKNKTLDDFNEASSDKISFVSTKGTTWILNNEEMQKGDWIKGSKDYLYRAISAYKKSFPPGRLICVFLGLGENAVEEMADIIESCFSILGNTASSCVTVICERKSVADAFIKASKPSLQREINECSLVGIPWPLFEEIVREMVGPSKFDKRGATTELPFYSGQFREVLNKVINSWDDLEVYSPTPRLPSLAEAIEKERYAFYKGGQASQTNLFHEHSIPRTLETEISNKVERALVSLHKAKNSEYNENNDTSCHVKTISVPYEPGSGATTLCRRILWKKRKDYRCAVVKAITTSTDYYIEKLQSIAYDEKNASYSLPVLVLVDNFPESDARHLTERIVKKQTKCVVLSTFSVTKSATISNFDVTPLGKLDETETSLVKNILINITSDTERQRESEVVLEREKRFIWFGLQLFGREYLNIEDRLKDHIDSILLNSLGISEMILNMCCFLHKYSGGYSILPHSVVLDFLYYSGYKTKEQLSETRNVHEIFGGLLLQEQNENHGYYGWRPAHSLVSEVVTSKISIEDTAVHFLEEICKGNTFAVKCLRQQVFKVLLERKRISEPFLLEEQGTDDSDGSDFEDGVFGFSEVRTKYSPVIEDILDKDTNISGALRVLITICEEAFQTEDKPYAWQQLARFMGYEMRAIEMNESDDLHKRLHKAMVSEKEPDLLPMPRTGIEAAHFAVDIAIDHQPNYSHHYGTKGLLYLLQLSEPKEGPSLPLTLPEAIGICRRALEVYDKALMTSHGHSHHSMIGKIQATVSLLKIVKGLPCFSNENESFSRFLQTREVPAEMGKGLSKEDKCYVQSLSSTTLDLLNELFRNVKLKLTTTYDENEIRGLNNAKIRASKLRRAFYKITGYDRKQLSNVESSIPLSPTTKKEPALYQQIVQDVLFIQDETPYSTWSNLSETQVAFIYKLLKPLCQGGYGSHNDMLIFSKACLQLQERPSVNELDEIVSIWVKKFPDSEWAHLFNYMIHFPTPNGSLATYNQSTKASIKKCDSIVREKGGLGFRKSSAEYFLGKGLGLNAIVKRQEFDPKSKTKTEFWRSKETTRSLERVRGQKEITLRGVITYQGIQLHFDNTLYPNESKDDLWFYIGFSVAGPYAYDPVDNDTYADISRQTRESASTSSVAPSSGPESSSIPKVGMMPGNLDQGKPGTFANSPKPFTRPVGRVPTINSSGDWQASHSTDQTSVSSSMGHRVGRRCDKPSNVGPRQQPVPLYSSALLHEGAKAKTPVVETAQKRSNPWKRVEGSRDKEKKTFDPKYVDANGRLRHGAFVRGLQKTQECVTHLGPSSGHGATKRCRYAHSWKGDTVQYVCTICSDKNLIFCKEKVEHKDHIWNLGPYLTANGTIWKGSGDSK